MGSDLLIPQNKDQGKLAAMVKCLQRQRKWESGWKLFSGELVAQIVLFMILTYLSAPGSGLGPGREGSRHGRISAVHFCHSCQEQGPVVLPIFVRSCFHLQAIMLDRPAFC